MITIAICDDDTQMLDNISKRVEAFFINENQVIKINKFSNSEILSMSVQEGDRFDMFILDVEMPYMDGITLATNIRELQPNTVIIFLTSHIGYASRGYPLKALRYVQKLKIQTELPEALNAAVNILTENDTKSIFVNHYKSLTRVMYSDIIYVQKFMRDLHIYTVKQGMLKCNKPVKELFDDISDSRFAYVERSCFINLNFIRNLKPREVILNDDTCLPIGRNYTESLKDAVIAYCKGD